MTKKALIIIDMQKSNFKSDWPQYDITGIVERINGLAKMFREKGLPVIYIMHNEGGTGEFEKNTSGYELLDELEVETTDIFIDKSANDAFYGTNFQSKLIKLLVNELIISGSSTDMCVESTVQSALGKDYSVTVVEDGHTTVGTPFLKAEKVIEHYNWVWQNMIPTKGQISVEKYERIKSDYQQKP